MKSKGAFEYGLLSIAIHYRYSIYGYDLVICSTTYKS